MTEVFCDYLTCTVPLGEFPFVVDDLKPVLDAAAFMWETPKQLRNGRGVVMLTERYGVGYISASGAALEALRASLVFGDYLACIGSAPHRVTKLDAALDIPEASSRLLLPLYERALSETGIHLTRKRIPITQVKLHRAHHPCGKLGYGLYLGKKGAPIQFCGYDKALELRDKYGELVPGELTRYELKVKSEHGPTLRDAFAPAPLFWHFASPDLLPRPPDVAEWKPHAEGFQLEKRPTLLPAELLRRRIESSTDIDRLLDLADRCGPQGVEYLCMVLQQYARRRSPHADRAPAGAGRAA